MIHRTTVTRAAASLTLIAALVVATTGCTFISRQATLIKYDPSNGVGADIGAVQVRNAIALIGDDEGTASLLVTLINSGKSNASVALQYTSEGKKQTETIPVAAGESVSFGNSPDEEQIIVLSSEVEAGALLPVYVQYGDYEGTQLMVPVLEAEGAYDGLQPEPIETPEPTVSPANPVSPTPSTP
ncbi:MAG: hypothetical protein ACRCSP_00385 [Rhodoglobus sp.]